MDCCRLLQIAAIPPYFKVESEQRYSNYLPLSSELEDSSGDMCRQSVANHDLWTRILPCPTMFVRTLSSITGKQTHPPQKQHSIHS